jgi:hypothetical protein
LTISLSCYDYQIDLGEYCDKELVTFVSLQQPIILLKLIQTMTERLDSELTQAFEEEWRILLGVGGVVVIHQYHDHHDDRRAYGQVGFVIGCSSRNCTNSLATDLAAS